MQIAEIEHKELYCRFPPAKKKEILPLFSNESLAVWLSDHSAGAVGE